jgi:hypothetical protein
VSKQYGGALGDDPGGVLIMSDEVLVALIGLAGSVATGLLGAFGSMAVIEMKGEAKNLNPGCGLIGLATITAAVFGLIIGLLLAPWIINRLNLGENLEPTPSTVLETSEPTPLATTPTVSQTSNQPTEIPESTHASEGYGTVTRAQVESWNIGLADRDTVIEIIYDEIHTVPGKTPFSEGDTIPKGVLLTSDLGINWSRYPIRRLAHNGGGWGVFESLESFTVGHADDLDHEVGGEYWFIKE